MQGVGSSAAGELGQIVREARRKLGLSQEELADKCGLHRNAVGLIERGERTPNIDTLIALACGLETRPSLLVGRLERQLEKR
jgi:transcriptional regulator with XRE-family HTH domain